MHEKSDHDEPTGVDIHEASAAEIAELRKLVIASIEANPEDPHLASFRHEMTVGPDPAERFAEYAVLVDGEIGAHCKINFQPQADDINAYGDAAADMYANQRIATLTGDMVAPAFRGQGLHAKMIQYRLALLTRMNFTYALCGILVGNDVSRDNYLRLGFEPIGEKDIDWGDNAVGERIKRVVLYAHRLHEHDVPTS